MPQREIGSALMLLNGRFIHVLADLVSLSGVGEGSWVHLFFFLHVFVDVIEPLLNFCHLTGRGALPGLHHLLSFLAFLQGFLHLKFFHFLFVYLILLLEFLLELLELLLVYDGAHNVLLLGDCLSCFFDDARR